VPPLAASRTASLHAAFGLCQSLRDDAFAWYVGGRGGNKQGGGAVEKMEGGGDRVVIKFKLFKTN